MSKTAKRQYNIWISKESAEALNELFERLDIQGQRGSRFSPGLEWLGQTVAGAFAESVAAIEIAAGCASGEEWHELIEVIEPKWSESSKPDSG